MTRTQLSIKTPEKKLMPKTIIINDITYTSKQSPGCGGCAFEYDYGGCVSAREYFDCATLGIIWQEATPAPSTTPESEKTFTLADIENAWKSTNIDTLADLVKALDKVTDPEYQQYLALKAKFE